MLLLSVSYKLSFIIEIVLPIVRCTLSAKELPLARCFIDMLIIKCLIIIIITGN